MKQKNKILGIFGCGGLGREILETANQYNQFKHRYDNIIFIDDNPDLDEIAGRKVFSLKALPLEYREYLEIIIAIGEPCIREKIVDRVKAQKIGFATLIHPNVVVSDRVNIGEDCYVGPFSFISCDVTIGAHTLIQPHATIGHDCHIGNNVIISSMDALSGHVIVGDNTYIGVATAVIQGASIGRDSIIGMSSSVLRDIPDGVIALGNPARAMKKNERHKVFS